MCKAKVGSFIFFLILTNSIVFAQGAKKEGTLRDGALQSAIMELNIHTTQEISTNYIQLHDCANYKPVGICLKLFPLQIRVMQRYYVPFQLTEGNVRPDATTFVKRQDMKRITETANQKIQGELKKELKQSHKIINQQKSDPELEFPGEVDDKMKENLKKYHKKDESFIGLSAEDGQTSGYAVGSNHQWHNTFRNRAPFNQEENMYGWCHDYSLHAYSGKKDKHPEIKPFTALGVLVPDSFKKRMIPLIAYFAGVSQDRQLFEDLADRTPKKGEPNLTACYKKRQTNQIGHPEKFAGKDADIVPRQQQGKEENYKAQKGDGKKHKVCPGKGFQGPAGPFWIFGKTYFPAGNAMMGSLRGLIVAWNTTVKSPKNKYTVDHDTGRHRLHSYDKEFQRHPSDHMQRIWPKPPLEGWKKGCSDTKDKGFYIPPDIRPEDNQEANIVKDENFGSHYRFAHYTSIVCCPQGWIPITTEQLKEG
jgi:hypothetical protein